MSQKLSPITALLLTVPPLMWAGNAVVGRLVTDLVPPITLNFLRWFVALFILLPLAWRVLRPRSGLWSHWRRFGLLSLLGVGCYNALQYLALQTSTPLNVTLVAASGPFWMLIIGALFFKAPVRRMQQLGALLSISGVLVVLSRGQWAELMAVRLVAGDMYVLLATACWSFYSWLLSRRDEPEAIRNDWAAFLLGQVVFGLGWSGLFAGLEWTFTDAHIVWGWPLITTLAFVAVGPAVLAYRCWGLGIQQAGPAVAGFFANLTPLFAAVLSAAFLGELPHLYHVAAFALIVGGIVVSARH
ncbi:DMT family transporter [Limnohabitans sp. Jir72]|uniref:DMT family transporter n=1 Tax=Limnohabitans sp. Jir72 TaxID=1977909 RepID=UPI000D3A7F0A|nr:DMT family transporter [Limnohabitans sp. Jir72]PUE33799.1 EamA family transporter [Limnohabitans sp. Jir72]